MTPQHAKDKWVKALENDLEKSGNKALIEILSEMRDAQISTDERLSAMEADMRKRDERFEGLFEAFPNGDVLGHRHYHELIIQKTEAYDRLCRAVMEKTISGLIWSGLIFLGIAVWNEIADKIAFLKRGG